MTGTNEKLRSLFLAALMVFSVFAGTVALSGTAAAAGNNPSIVSAVEYDSGNVEVKFDEPINTNPIGGGDITVYVDGQTKSISNVQHSAGDQALYFTLDSGDVTPNRNLTIKVDVNDAGTQKTLRAKQATVTSNDIKEANAQTGAKRIYQGETLALVAQGQNTDIIVSGPNGVQLDGGTDTSSKVLPFATSNLQVGSTYSAEFGSAPNVRNFTINDLDLQASVSKTNVSPGGTVNVSVSAIRGNSPVTLLINGEAVASQNLGGNAQTKFVDVSIGSSPGGNNYTLEVVDNQTGITAEAGTVATEFIPQQSVSIANVENDQRGDIASITLDVSNSQVPVTLTLGTQNDAFLSNVSAIDGNDDGQIVLNWNTFNADSNPDNTNNGTAANDPITPTDNAQWDSANDDLIHYNVSTQIQDGPKHIISSGTYEMSARVGARNATQDDTDDQTDNPRSVFNSSAAAYQAEDVGTVTINQRDDPSIQLWTAPSGQAGFYSGANADVSNISSAVDAGNLTQNSDIATGDILITEINVDGLEGALDTYSVTELRESGKLGAWLNHSQRIGSASNTAPNDIFGNSTTTASFLMNSSADTYYFVQDTDSNDVDVQAGQTYDTTWKLNATYKNSANFGLVAPSGGEFSDEVVSTSFDVVEGGATIDTADRTGNVEVRAESGQAISGTSTFAPGTELRVRAQAKTGSASQFIIGPETVTVDENGEWELTADFSGYEVGSTFNVRVSKGSTQLATADGEIRGPPEVSNFNFADQSGAGEVVAVDSVDLNYGGFVAIENQAGDVLGVSDYINANTPKSNLRIPVSPQLTTSQQLTAVPYMDTNGNEEFDAGTDEAYSTTQSAQFTLTGAEADFQVSDLSAPSNVTAGESVNVSATISNEGGASATQNVEFRLDGDVLDSTNVTLDPGANTTVTFTADTTGLSAGDYEHGVYTDDGEQTATLTVETEGDGTTPTPTPPTPTPTTSTPTEEPGTTTTTEGESGPGFGIIVSVLALLGAALLAARRNN